MKAIPMILVLAAALAAGCQKSSTVKAEGGRRLTLVRPASMKIERGGMAKAEIALKRSDMPGDVTIRFDRLPAGVDVVDENQKVPGERATYTLKAAEKADLVANHVAEVTVSGPDGIAATESFEITVTEKK